MVYTGRCQKKTLDEINDLHASYLYDQWRDQWLYGVQSQAVSLLCHHGLASALALSAPIRPPASREDSIDVDHANSLLTQATFMSCALLDLST